MSFKQDGYFVIREFLNQDFVEFIQQYFFLRIQSGEKVDYGSPQAAKAFEIYSDPLVETILNSSCDYFSEVTGINLLPTYTYSRLYQKDDELKSHIDREACEVSVTLALGLPEGEEINPICFSKTKDMKNAIEIMLNPGDVCIYKGCDLWHWRPPFTQKWYLQAFLHYVNANGPHKNCKYDERTNLNMAPARTARSGLLSL